MANTVQARKRAQQAEVRRQHNTSLRSRFRTSIKRVLKAVRAGDKSAAQIAFNEARPIIDGMVNKGLVHRNQVARHKSRLNDRVRAMV
ncbi:MAG: 30S ribosomal protein S20 [Gammaproteobacteria bacterium]|nr:30S ribosomal protein S20 [Gammaproteobacteria bacterium]